MDTSTAVKRALPDISPLADASRTGERRLRAHWQTLGRLRDAEGRLRMQLKDSPDSLPMKDSSDSLPTKRVETVRRFGKMVASSASMRGVVELLERFAPTEVSLSLMGETGTGKDVLAHAVHDHSQRAAGPFIVFDCGAVAPNLAESELLGHERGAFTGAVSAHAGAFERAHGGTLFLDEIGELPLELQPRLLRALESRKVRRVGGKLERAIDVRIVTATHRDLQADVRAGRFREDLFFRLASAIVPVPPLRERLEDLPVMIRSLLDDLGYPHIEVAEETIHCLQVHAWPGNVRELKNTLACAVAFVEANVLEPSHVRFLSSSTPPEASIDRLPLAGQTLESLERAAIRQTLGLSEGNKAQAARSLGIAVSTLYEKVKKYGL